MLLRFVALLASSPHDRHLLQSYGGPDALLAVDDLDDPGADLCWYSARLLFLADPAAHPHRSSSALSPSEAKASARAALNRSTNCVDSIDPFKVIAQN